MCCDQIVCIENVVDIQATYSILNLTLSRLIADIIKGNKQGLINVLDVNVFLYALRDVPFRDEKLAMELILELKACIAKELYANSKKWTIVKFMKKIKVLQELIMWDYMIEGSLTMYDSNEIAWDVDVSFMKIKGHGIIFSVA